MKPDAAVVVATLRALKLHGGGGIAKAGMSSPPGLTAPNQDALEKGIGNLEQHIANVKSYGMSVVIAINAFQGDTQEEWDYVMRRAIAAELSVRRFRLTGPTEVKAPKRSPMRS